MLSVRPQKVSHSSPCYLIKLCAIAAVASAGTLSACGGGGSGGLSQNPAGPATTYDVSASVSGLQGSGLVLKMNNDTVPVSTDGRVSFPTRLASGSAYAVSVEASPSRPAQTCNVAHGTGTIQSADVANITVSCATEGTAPTSTQVTLDPGLQSALSSLITKIASPMQTAPAGSWVDISTSTPTGKSLILALDAEGGIVMAAVTADHRTQLTAASTAQALVVLTLDDLAPHNLEGVFESITTASGYSELVVAIESALSAGRSPLADLAIIEQVLAVTTQTADALTTAAKPSVRRAVKVAEPHLQAPFVLKYDTALGGVALQIPSSGRVTNRTPIQWAIRTRDVDNAELASVIADPHRGLLGVDTPIAMDPRGTSITIGQTLATRVEAGTEVVLQSLEAALAFADAPNCALEVVQTAVAEYVSSRAAAIMSLEGFLDSVLNILKDPDTYTSVLSACTSGSNQEIAEAIADYYSKVISVPPRLYTLGSAAAIGLTLKEYWDVPDSTFGICFNRSGGLANCTARLTLEPRTLEIAAGGGSGDLTLGAFDSAGVQQALPAGVTCESDTPFLSVDPQTCRVTSAAITALGPFAVNAKDPATGTVTQSQENAQVSIVVPQITPAQSTIAPGGNVLLSLRSPSGALMAPPGVVWETSDPSSSHLSMSLEGAVGGRYFSNTPPQTPGEVTIIAKYANGMEFSRATVTVTPGELVVYEVQGGPISPTPVLYSATTTTTNDSGTTSTTSTNPSYRLSANFASAPGSPETYRICRRGSQWIDAAYSLTYTRPASRLPPNCQGTMPHDEGTASVTVNQGSLHATFVLDSSHSTNCDLTAGGYVTLTSSASTNHQEQDYTIDLETGVGSGSFTVSETGTSSQTTGSPGNTTTTTTSSSTTGGASGSWTPPNPSNVLMDTRITRFVVPLGPDDPLPSYCTSR